MNKIQTASSESVQTASTPAAPNWHRFLPTRILPTVLALGFILGIVYLGVQTGWSLPKLSDLASHKLAADDEWCAEHAVPEADCVECQTELLPRHPAFGWCRLHGVPECPLEHPEVAETSPTPVVTEADRERAARALAFAPRTENSSKCKLHERRIQFTSIDATARLGVQVSPVTRATVTESIVANGEIVYDPNRVARLSARVPGTVWRVEKKVGDRVQRGDVLAIIDAVEVGKAKAELQQAISQVEIKTNALARLRELEGTVVAIQDVQEAEASLEEAKVRLLSAEQALVNLGIPVQIEELRKLRPEQLARQLQFAGIPEEFVASLDTRPVTSNLIALRSPLDGEVTAASAVTGETVDVQRILFVVVDTRQMLLVINTRMEDANLLKPGQTVRFQHADHPGWDWGSVTWVSPAADETTRTVPVRVELSNTDGRHHAHTFGSAQIVLREETEAIVVPNEAVHWEGDCNIVFVRDKRFDEPDAPKVFHVRKVRPGTKDGANTEIIAGVLPGEAVVTRGSGILRAELLKNKLGEC